MVVLGCVIVFVVIFAAAAYSFKTPSDLPKASQARVEKVENEVNWRCGDVEWTPLVSDTLLDEETEIQTGDKGRLNLQFAEGSTVEVKPGSEIKLESLHDPTNQLLIWILLNQGEISVRIAPFPSYRGFSVDTEAAMFIIDEGVPRFSVKQDTKSGLTTLAVEEGVVIIQPENPELQSINLGAGEQISLNSKKMGPIVAVGSPPSLEEPKELVHRQLDLGPLQQVCEMAEGEGQKEICGTWLWDLKAQAFNATWQNGAKAVLKVEKMSDGEIVLTRRDLSGTSEGLTARYVGRNAGDAIEGDVPIQLLAGTVTWEFNGSTSTGTWRARSPFFLGLGEVKK